MPIATRPIIDSPIAKGTWIMLPTKVLRLLPTNSTLKPNAIRKIPWDPRIREYFTENIKVFCSFQFRILKLPKNIGGSFLPARLTIVLGI